MSHAATSHPTTEALSQTPAVEVRALVKEFVDRSQRVVRAVNNVSLSIREGEFFALLGPSGCGKTTTLRVIAGFEDPTAGEVLLRGRPVLGIPAFHRPVNTVFQDYALFPHMSVRQNVMFGLKMARVPEREARRRADEALELVRLPNLGDRRPSQLSGGQRQRVALARALVNRPAVLLLDEPLGALDLKLRKAMQSELKALQQHVGITFVYVTHDQEEALAMADRMAVMDGGRVLQVGAPDAVYERPESRFVADFIGETNFIEGAWVGADGHVAVVRLDDGRSLRGAWRQGGLLGGERVVLAVRPEKIALKERAAAPREAEVGMARLLGRIEDVQYIGTDTRYRVDCGGGVVLVVRVQNQRQGFVERLPVGAEVLVNWSEMDASLLRS